MRSSLFFLSVGLLALGANLTGTSGQNITVSEGIVVLGCKVKTHSSGTAVSWYRNDEAMDSSFDSDSNPVRERQDPGIQIIYSMLVLDSNTWGKHDNYTCVMRSSVLHDQTVQKTTDKDTGNPSASGKTIFGPRFQDNQTDFDLYMRCSVTGKHPLETSIWWTENGRPLPEDSYAIHNGSEDPDFLSSTLDIDETFHNGSCTMVSKWLKIQKTKEKTLA